MSASLVVRRWSLAVGKEVVRRASRVVRKRVVGFQSLVKNSRRRALKDKVSTSANWHRTLNCVIPTGVRPSASGWSNGVEEPGLCGWVELVSLILLIAVLSPVLAAQDLPLGWRRPTKSETADEWRNKSRTRFLIVSGDFDGDGRRDVAEILVNPSGKKFGVFVKLAATRHWQSLVTYDLDSLGRYAIEFVKPGKYKTACGKGYGDWACAHGEPEVLVLRHSAIDFVYTHSADIFYYWDGELKNFRAVQMSD